MISACTCRANPPLKGKPQKYGGGGIREGDFLGGNEKIGTVAADIVAGPPAVGGSCLMITKGCEHCYAQSMENVFNAENALLGKHERAFAILRDSAAKYRDGVIAEIEEYEARTGRSLDPVRIHGFGDFFSPEHIQAWIEIAQHFIGRTRFFGTTRMWQAFRANTGNLTKFHAPLNALRALPNVFLGASVDHANRDKLMPARFGNLTSVEWLRANGWNIWNALDEFADAEARESADVEIFIKRQGESDKDMQLKAREQFKAARASGALIGVGCLEQSGLKPHCAACNHCLHKSDGTPRWDVTFAYHQGTTKSVEAHGHRAIARPA